MSEQKMRQIPVGNRTAGAVWLIQIISGLLLILLLGLHMIAHHFIAEGGLRDFREVIDYVSNPIIFILEIAFLIVVTPHAVLGLNAVILDLGLSESAERTVTWVLRALLVVTLAYGIWLAVALQRV